jgi:hypothetical protein
MFKASADAEHELQGFCSLLVVEFIWVIANGRNYACSLSFQKTLLFDVGHNDVGDTGALWEHS